jgi:NAD(P)-dependent dehydrogenase (short-subunit alcohol dehydrogenase family)
MRLDQFPSMDLSDQGVIVTGGGSGIGEEIARAYANLGAGVVILDIAPSAENVASDIRADGGIAQALLCDIAKSMDVTSAFDEALRLLPSVDVLINNAGVSHDEGVRRLSDANLTQTIGVNLFGAIHCAREAARIFVPQRRGAIVNVASRAWLGWFGQTAYSASKGGVVSLTRSLAIELARHEVRVNCIAPGLINTPMLASEPQEVRDRLMSAQPTGTIGEPADVARAAVFLGSRLSSSITGQVLYVCGGKSLYASPG